MKLRQLPELVYTMLTFFSFLTRMEALANAMGGDTWLEGWQGAEGCGAPVAPFDGSNAATYSHDASAGTLTVYGLGAHIGLPKR